MPNPDNIYYDEEMGIYIDSETDKMYYDEDGKEEYDPAAD